jgi:flagellar biosynthesis protein FlhF
MQLRTFIAKDMREALSQMRSEMGPDAVIVASQRAKGGGVMVRAAFDAPVANDEIDLVTEETEVAQADSIELVGSFEQIFHDGLIRRLRNDGEPIQRTQKNFNRAEFLTLLRGHRSSDTLAHQLAEAAEKSGLTDMTLALAAALDKRMRASPLVLSETRALLLLGPSGAGKTAVAAKIAAHARLVGRAVRLVASDTSGAGAVERLETFAAHLGTEAVRAESAEAVAAIIADTGDILTIVDTAGFDPRNAKARTAYAALARLPHAEPLGVLSATGDAEEIGEIAAALLTLGAKRLVVTGLDVTRRLGALLAAATQGAGLANITRSPFISGGLETLTPLSLSRMLIEANTGNADRGSPQ